jgi:periplasmic protein TonB
MPRRLLVLTLLGLAPALLAAGHPSLNAYFQSTLTDAAYQKKTFDKVAKAWKTPAAKAVPSVGAKAVIRAVIAKDGKLLSTDVHMSSGSKAWDEAALAAVKKAAPYDPLPASYKYPTLEVDFHVSVVP